LHSGITYRDFVFIDRGLDTFFLQCAESLRQRKGSLSGGKSDSLSLSVTSSSCRVCALIYVFEGSTARSSPDLFSSLKKGDTGKTNRCVVSSRKQPNPWVIYLRPSMASSGVSLGESFGRVKGQDHPTSDRRSFFQRKRATVIF
jgi:hypothetical protein